MNGSFERYLKETATLPAFVEQSVSEKVFVSLDVMQDQPGVLTTVVECFAKYNVNMTSIDSKLQSFARSGPSFNIDFEGDLRDTNVQKMLMELRSCCADLQVHEPRECSWFPVNIRDLDLTKETLDGGTDLINEDHPGFQDESYRKRREEIVELAQHYQHGMEIGRINYNEEETETWGVVYEKVMAGAEQYACREFLEIIPQLEKHCGYSPTNIPQLADISNFLQQRTGFTLRPVQGLLSARDFLNALAFRVFFSTQYIRHHGNPSYTPEPDICHELLGHVPMFANESFAEFSHNIGLASLAASDADIDRLATLYWFTVEFGLCKEPCPSGSGTKVKAFGAGLLSSFGEIEWACADAPSEECRQAGGMMRDHADLLKPELRPLEAASAANQAFPITTSQPVYFVAESLEDAKQRLGQFCDELHRPFHPQYDPLTQNIKTSKAVRRRERESMLELQAQKQRDYFENLQSTASPSSTASSM